jgi:GTP-binding nuclear protein Ran
MTSNQEYKIIIIADGGVGKTTFINHHKNIMFDPRYEPTKGYVIHPLSFNTNYGEITFNVWDTAGQERFNHFFENYYNQACGAIVLFDTSSKLSLRSVDSWVADIKKIAGEIPINIYGTKCDIPNGINDPKYKYISVKNNINLGIPFLNMAQQLTGHNDLIFLPN